MRDRLQSTASHQPLVSGQPGNTRVLLLILHINYVENFHVSKQKQIPITACAEKQVTVHLQMGYYIQQEDDELVTEDLL